MHKEVGMDSMRAIDLNWPKRYSIPYDMLSNKTEGVGQVEGLAT